MRLPRRATQMAAGALVALLLAGCSVAGNVAARPASAAASPIATSTLQQQVPLPLDAYEPTPLQVAQVKYLVERFTQVCMRGFGLAYAPELSTSSIAQSVRIDQEFQSRMYGVSDPVAIRTYGYHLPSWTQGTAAPDLLSEMPAYELSVLDGTATSYDHQTVPQGGCETWASSRLTRLGIEQSTEEPDGDGAEALVAQIQTNAFEQAQSDPRVLSVFGKWSACMRAHGDDYQTPFTAAGDPRWATGAPTAREIATAEQDLACKTQVNLQKVDSSVVADYQNAAISANAATLDPVKTQVAAQAVAVQRAMDQLGT